MSVSEERLAADGVAYTYADFERWYGTQATQMWEAAAATEHSQSECRVAADGISYSYADFEQYYGTTAADLWNKAAATELSERPGLQASSSGNEPPHPAEHAQALQRAATDNDDADSLARVSAEHGQQPSQTAGASSHVPRADATEHSSSSSAAPTPPQTPLMAPMLKKIKLLMAQLYKENCSAENPFGVQTARQLEHELSLTDYPWQQILGDAFPANRELVRSVASFFPDEADSNRGGAPRLDIVLTFNDGMTVRYHPQAKLIWSTEPQPTLAMQKRMNLARKYRNRR